MSSVKPAFWNRLACFAFESYLKSGIGVCILREDFPGPIADAPFSYLPFDPDNPAFDKLPVKTVTMLDAYDPKREVVLAVIDKAGKAMAMQLTAQKMGFSPIDAFREDQRKKGFGKFIPGEVVYLKHDLLEISHGPYVFLRRKGGMMELTQAGIDPETDDICRTETVLKCHSDFEACFMDVNGVLVGTRE